MDIVSDASVFLSIVLNEADRDWIIERTCGHTLVSPEVLPYEIGNALIAVTKRGRITGEEALQAFHISQRIAVRLLPVHIHEALKIAARFNIHAYDAYYLQCCIENDLYLISLDVRMCDVAKNLGIKIVG